MTNWMAIPFQTIRREWVLWSALFLAGTVLYYAGLLLVMTFRFDQVPNYAVFYHFIDSYSTIWRSTPSATDALHIMTQEPLFETGFRSPSFGIAEWTLTIVLPNLIQVMAVSALGATFAVLMRESRRLACRANHADKAALGIGAGIMAMCSASLTWVVCCASPSWYVALTIMGVSLSVAQAIGAYYTPMILLGMGLFIVAIVLQARRIASASGLRAPN
ncbi:MAG: hypothetical protein P8009_04490 [Gammaproteobacteria bacterium]